MTNLANVRFALAAAALTLVSVPVAADSPEPYPLEYFALRDVVSNVEVSPDGEHVAMMKIMSRDGNPMLHIHQTDDMEADPFVVNANPMEIVGYGWVSDSNIVLQLRQKVRDRIDGQNEGVYRGAIALLNVEEKTIEEFDEANPGIENLLPYEEDKIIISMQPGMEDNLAIREAFRPRAYYKLDLNKGTKQLMIRGKLELGAIDFDAKGNPRFARGFDRGSQEYVWFYREPGGDGWDEFYRQHEDDFEDFSVRGLDPSVPGNVLVSANRGDDTTGLYSFNVKNRTFDELVYKRNDVDIYGVRYHSNEWARPDEIVAVGYYKDKFRFEYFDEIEGATYNQLEELIPHSHYVRITSRSRDGNTLTVQNTGPRDPGTYYLYKEGEFTTIGSKQPLMKSEELADVEYVTYPSRDGKQIPGFVTIPNGEPPFPLVVLPHGGPFVLETIIHDEWSQMLANNGYLVLQPQYRGSRGYGLDFYKSAWVDGSESGFAMQDDKDDGALYLIERGLADPDRVAMFGWSYGGYAALVAASRSPQIYQCVIAGAAVTDMVKQVNTIANEGWFRGSVEIEQMSYRKGALNPIDEVKNVNVPILMVHGTVDQRVQPVQARIYIDELEEHNKPHKVLWLEGADHFSNTLFYDHQIKLYESMTDFLANDCGMKGEKLRVASADQAVQ